MLTAEQLEQRKTLLTASDVPAVLGISAFQTAFAVWHSKVHGGEGSGETWRTLRGHAVEPIILAAIAKDRGLRVERRNVTKTHAILTWFGATIDGEAFDASGTRVAICEAKDVGLNMVHHWTDGDEEIVPDYVLAQVQAQLTVERAHRALVGAWLATEDEPRIYEVDHDPELEAAILEECGKFWTDHVLAKVPPPEMTDEEHARLLATIFPRPTKPVLTPATPQIEIIGGAYMRARADEAEAKARKEDLAAKLKIAVAEHEGVAGQGWRATWKERKGYEVKGHTVEAARVLDVREVKNKETSP